MSKRLTKTYKQTRRGNKEGTIYQRKDGKWCAQVLIGYGADGKPKRKTHYGETRAEVSAWLAFSLGELYCGKIEIEADCVTLRAFATEWLSRFKQYEIGTKTLEGYWSSLNNHIFPELGDEPLAELTTLRIQGLLYSLQSEKELGQRSITLVRSTLIQIFDHSLTLRLVESNPARATKLPKRRKKLGDTTEKAIPIKLREQILQSLSDEYVMKPIVTTLMFTGMRIGELLGLQWKHVDFDRKMISIEQAVVQELTIDKNGKTLSRESLLGATKTSTSKRTIRVADNVLDCLKDWQVNLCMKKKPPEAITPESFIF